MKTIKRTTLAIALFTIISGCSDEENNREVKSILIDLLKNSHSEQHWFVPMKTAIEGLTAEQSNWRDGTENHSIGELVSHLVFWNEINLRALKGEDMTDFEVDNETTFKMYTENEWQSLVHKLDSVQTAWEPIILNATDEQVTQWSQEIANIQAHNAYHTGQIIYIRKQNGWWTKK